MYKLEIVTINANADLKYFSAWLESNYAASFKGFAVGTKAVIYFEPEPTAAEKTAIEAFYSGLTASDVLESNPMQASYDQAEVDGREYFKLAKAKYFGVKLQSGELTVANLSYVYTKLTEVAMRLNNGDQGLALHYLVNDLGAITQTDIDNGYTQEVHDNIVADITNYLNA